MNSNRQKIFAGTGLIVVLVLTTLLKGGEGQIQLTAFELITFTIVIMWLLRVIKNGQLQFVKSTLHVPFLLFFMALVVSTTFSTYRYNSINGLYQFLAYILIFYVALNLTRDSNVLKTVSFVIISLAIFEAILSIYQHFIGMGRVSGTLSYATYLIDYLAVGMCLILSFLLFANPALWQKILLGIGLVILLSAFSFTGSRAGAILLFVIFVSFGLMKGKKWFAVAVLGLIILFTVIPNPITKRILHAGEVDIYALQRVNIWKQAIHVGTLRPFTGVGLRNFGLFAKKFNFPVNATIGRYVKHAEIAHNQYLQIFAEMGLLGIVSFIFILFSLFRSFIISRLSVDKDKKEYFRIGFFVSIIVFLVHFLVDNPLYLPCNGIIFFLSLGAVMSQKSTVVKKSFAPKKIYILLIAVVFIASVYFTILPCLSAIYYDKARDYTAKKKYEAAIQYCKLATNITPNRADCYSTLGKLYGEKFLKTNTLKWLLLSYRNFQFAIKTNPHDSECYQSLADLLYKTRGIIAAKAISIWLEKAAELDPYNPFIRAQLGQIYFEADDLTKAIPEFKKAIEIEPNYVICYYQLGVLYQKLGVPEKAEKYFEKVHAFKDQSLESKCVYEYEKKLVAFDYRLIDKNNPDNP